MLSELKCKKKQPNENSKTKKGRNTTPPTNFKYTSRVE